MKNYIPLLVNLNARKVLIVGGGKAALLKTKGVARFTSEITILSPELKADFSSYDIRFIAEPYAKGKVEGYDFVYACTDNRALNGAIGKECEALNILHSICDNPEASSFVSPATYKTDGITISVGTNGTSPLQAIHIRNQIEALIESGQITLNLE